MAHNGAAINRLLTGRVPGSLLLAYAAYGMGEALARVAAHAPAARREAGWQRSRVAIVEPVAPVARASPAIRVASFPWRRDAALLLGPSPAALAACVAYRRAEVGVDRPLLDLYA